ncbi:hypothetical protein NB700_001882 [Xanthomonas sacchari]|uniref:Cardiolipin synthase N-terminal domain-containing protein n=1 Tax=Xanthomonas sacchari TaxID=56458 RepID=A0ABT3DUY9_9XANT|nr:hypothetical protein [Xanthomonas sacchari]
MYGRSTTPISDALQQLVPWTAYNGEIPMAHIVLVITVLTATAMMSIFVVSLLTRQSKQDAWKNAALIPAGIPLVLGILTVPAALFIWGLAMFRAFRPSKRGAA